MQLAQTFQGNLTALTDTKHIFINVCLLEQLPQWTESSKI